MDLHPRDPRPVGLAGPFAGLPPREYQSFEDAWTRIVERGSLAG